MAVFGPPISQNEKKEMGIYPDSPQTRKSSGQLGCGSILLAVMIRGGFLSIEERAALEAVMGHPSETHGVARRANAVLLLDDGLSCVEVAKVLYLDDDTVRTWLKRYRAGGLDEMTLFDWHGRSGHLSREQEAELSAHLSQRLYRDTGEVAAHIKATYGVIYSHSGCIKVMHRLGFEYKRPKSLPAQADEAEQAAFIEAYDKLLNGLAADEVVYFADAVHPEFQSRPVHGWVKKGDKVALRRTSGRQRINLHGALNLENFHCPLVQAERINAASTIALFEMLEATNPGRVADLCLRRQCPLSPRPPGPTMAGETGLPHQAHLPTVLRSPPQRHRAIMGRHASRGDPQQLSTPASPSSPKPSTISSADDCHESGRRGRDTITDNFRIISHKDFRVLG